MTDPDVTPAEIRPSSRRALRLSVRALMVVVLIVCLVLGYFVQRAQVQRDAVAAINKTGGNVHYDWEKLPNRQWKRNPKPNGPKWLVEWLGIDYFGHVIIANLGPTATDADLELVCRMPNLVAVQAPNAVGVTDVGAAHLAGLSHLETVDLSGTKVTGAALVHLRDKVEMRDLLLAGLPIGDDDLANIAGLTKLEVLELPSTSVGDAGLAHLAGLVNMRQLWLASTPVEGPGLAHLKGMVKLDLLKLEKSRVRDLSALPPLPALKRLRLEETPVNDASLAQLPRLPAIENISLGQTGVTDVGLTSLLKNNDTFTSLGLEGTKITDAGLAPLLEKKGTLTGLGLAGTMITDAAAPTIAQLAKLRGLNLSRTKVTDATLDQLASLKSLVTINVEGAFTTSAGMDRLRRALPKLRTYQEIPAAQNPRSRAEAQAAAKAQAKPQAPQP